jgi:hypothetical protein
MSETQFQQGLEDLRKRLSAAGLNVLKQQEDFDKRSIFFEIGSPANNTDFMVSRNFLSDFHTEVYVQSTDDYIAAVAARHKCGSPEHFYCSSGRAIRVSVTWPIENAVYENKYTRFILF